MDGFDGVHVIVVVLLSFIASSITTAIGFGFGIILISCLQFFLPPVQLVGLAVIVGTANSAMRAVETRRIDTHRIAWRLIVPGVVTIFAGLAVLLHADRTFLQRLFSIIILTASLVLLLPIRRNITTDPPGSRFAPLVQIVAGALAGFLGGASAMSGPPVVLCSLIQNWPKMTAHAIFSRFFFVTGIVSFTVLLAQGQYNTPTIVVALCLMPVVWFGFRFGARLRNRIAPDHFRRYTMICLILLALVAFLNTFFAD